MNANRYVIYTDLDGSLIDHDSYDFTLAVPALAALQTRNIPIIPVSSKTRAEIEPLAKSLRLQTPFIVENGAAVFIPKTPQYSAFSELNLTQLTDYYVKAFAPSIHYWALVLKDLDERLPNAFTPFTQMTPTQLSELTGLNEQQAELAKRRDFSDPLFWKGREEQLSQLSSYCQSKRIQVVKGGRFIHLLKNTDKGRAVNWLHQQLQSHSNANLSSIALGDGENDLAMLNAVDFPVQIKSPAHDFPPFKHPNCLRTNNTGPAGWNEAIFSLIPELNTAP